MSTKINVTEIISGHFNTLKDASTNKTSKTDIATFIAIPLLLAILSVCLDLSLNNNSISLLMNFGAIFTALLLSVLVLIYDQGEKIKTTISCEKDIQKKRNNEIKKNLLNQLYYNICYSIIASILLVLICLIATFTLNLKPLIAIIKISFIFDINSIIITPIVIFLTINIILTIIMIVKRMHSMLTTD